jgi:hypothetical protein
MAQFFKKGLCFMCPPGKGVQKLVKDLCTYHYSNQWKHSSVLTHIKRNKERIPNLRAWYIEQISISTWECENCGAPIPNFSDAARYGAQAHILCKVLFPSVALHPSNRLHLGNGWGCDCHTKYDSSFDTAGSMPVFSLALERFELFAAEIAPEELKNLPPFFLDHYKITMNYV